MAVTYRVGGPATVSWGGTSLGRTKGGVFIRPNTQWLPVTVDAGGTEPVDFILAGKSCTVETVLVDVDAIQAAQPFIGAFLSNSDASNVTQIGKLLFDGDSTSSADLGKELTIVERNGTWTANQAAPSEPSALVLRSVQELQVPIAWLIAPDQDKKLFATVPSYIQAA